MHSLQNLIENYTELQARSYSGRGMYGALCLGVEAESIKQFCSQLMYAVADAGLDKRSIVEVAEALSDMCSDSMGLDQIFYFPSIEYSDPDEESEDEDEVEDDSPADIEF